MIPLARLSKRQSSKSYYLKSSVASMSTSASPAPRSAHRPPRWKAVAPQALPGSETYAAQSSLQKLPVPELSATLTRLKESLKPIAWDNGEYQEAVEKIDDFAAGIGPELQNRLLQRYDETAHWLEEWWDDGGYLGYRDSVVINVSYFYGFTEHPSHLRQTPAARAAGIARAAMLFRKRLKLGQIKPDGTKEGPFCMDTYRWMFDCCRLPGPQGLDWSTSYAKEGDTGDFGHLIVMRRNRVWKVDAAINGRILSTDEFERQIQYIYDNTTSEHPGVGVLTASNRDVWAKDYGELASSARNSEILHAIQSSAFIICLEDGAPTSAVDRSRGLWHGTVTNGRAIGLQNRWVDKPCQFIVYDNMYAGFMGEHSVMDGTPTVRLCDEVLASLADCSFDHGTPSSGESKSTPVPLDWEISPALSKAIASADAAVLKLIESQDLSYYVTHYGKAAIKQFGVSPDSWAQMIVQLAYRRLIGGEKRQGGTYEAATTRKFFKGRTEAIRVVSSESDAWVKIMDDPNASKEDKKRLFQAAVKKHITTARNCGNGQGIDRHLFGLRKLLKTGEETPALFSDPVLTRSSHWVLSTSAIFSKHFSEYGWGEVVPNGFGVAYMTGFDDRLLYTITSRTQMPNTKFIQEIARAAEDLYALYTVPGIAKL